MRSGRAEFWAGVSLGVMAGAAALYAGLRVWADRLEPELTTSDWCPGVDPSEDGRRVAGRLQASGAVDWKLCGDWEAHEPHLRATEPEYVADRETEVWCPGVDDIHPTSLEPTGPVRWDQCTATIRHNLHRRYDVPPDGWAPLGHTEEGTHVSASLEEVRASFEPGGLYHDPHPHAWLTGERDDGAECGHGAETPCPLGLSLGQHVHGPDGCINRGQPHDGPCLSAVHHTPEWARAFAGIQPPLIDPEDLEKFRAQMAEALKPLANFGDDLRKAMRPATPSFMSQCDRDHPHQAHAWSGGACLGIRPGEGRSPIPVPPLSYEHLVPTPCMRKSQHDPHGYPPEVSGSGNHYCPGRPIPPGVAPWLEGTDDA